jgi:hypothetical protein
MKHVIMKTIVAAIDLGENRAIPQTPCPLVQPEPKKTPTPTINPPTIKAKEDTGTANGTVPPSWIKTIGAMIAPNKNAARQPQSDTKGGIRPVIIPVIPAIRPWKAINNMADIPIRTPPPNEVQGVNSVTDSILNVLSLTTI